jgi:mono/diheme cytochrome c family protein
MGKTTRASGSARRAHTVIAEATARAAVPTRSAGVVEDARSLLGQRCVACHGPSQQQGGLRLDRKADALKGGHSGAVIRPGKSADSLLLRYVAGLDPKIVMPPSGERLSAAQVSLLRTWINQGAPWPDDGNGAPSSNPASHWSFQPPRRPVIPSVRGRGWLHNPIDAFVLARLERDGIAPSPEADRVTLIRRLSLDLLGLPPTLAEVNAFVHDPHSDAYERVVDRMLRSPHFGERWARHWLDLARYADSDGYEKDTPRPYAYYYRDWVIRAFNRDLPYDQFTVEQLAGDLLPGATLEQKLATGFHRNTLTNREGGVDAEEYRVKAVVDRVNTTGTVWLGLTVGCAQCHNHKFDPISQREYYRLFAFFNRAQEVDLPNPTDAELAAYTQAKRDHDAEHARLLAAVTEDERRELPARQARWEQRAQGPAPTWTLLRPASAVSAKGATLQIMPDGSVLAIGPSPATDTFTIQIRTGLAGITAFRLEVLSDPGVSGSGPSRRGLPAGNFLLSEIRVQREGSGASTPDAVALEDATANAEEKTGPVLKALDDNPKTGWDVRAPGGVNPVAVFPTRADVGAPGGTTLTFTLDQLGGQQRTLAHFRLLATTAPRPVFAVAPPPRVAHILATQASVRTTEQSAEIASYYRDLDPRRRSLEDAVAEHTRKAPPEPPARLHTLAENPQPPATHLLIRGDFLRPGEAVTPGTLEVLPQLRATSGTPTRLDLARWLVDPANPLTARVAVNRAWQHLFGRGLVATPDDFGTRGERPSHPELLDWLAVEFMAKALPGRTVEGQWPRADRSDRSHQPSAIDPRPSVPGRSSSVGPPSSDPFACGWSTKALVRLIVTSATYRQASRQRPELLERDPKNLLLARQNRFRVEAEIVRDLALATSGLLHPTVGGPSIRPPLPADVAALSYASGLKWVPTTGSERYKRGMYIHFQRTVPFPGLMTFDEPDGNVTCTRRERSNSPLQALTLLNDPVFIECAQALAQRILTEETSGTGARLRYAVRLCLAREPTPSEQARLRKLYGDLEALCRANPDGTAKLAGTDPPAGVSTVEAATWVSIARTLMNLDEFVTRD